ncbi:MAG: hypothetical protein EOO06_01405 [Chitinophagaceae bacterium]|nr:MAG: hypothetical protein EOO06_01405 [Chitinophagaceae bacterium]
MKKPILSLCLVLSVISTRCQVAKSSFAVGAGISLAVPVYNLTSSKTGGGADVYVTYGLNQKLAISTDVGVVGLPGKGMYPSTAIVPIRVGLRYFPLDKVYASAKAGLGVLTILKASANHFAYGVSGGYSFSRRIDASVYYDGYSNNNTSFGYAGLRIAYQF